MDNRAEVREFLISRRAKITPQQAGLSDLGVRKVPGLTLTLYAAEPGSPTAHALDLLASWTAVADDTTVQGGYGSWDERLRRATNRSAADHR